MPFRQHAQTQKRIRYKPLRKNGHQRAITKDRSRYFYVPLKESAETILLPKVEDGNYVLLFGPELRPSQHIWKKQKNCWRTSTVAYRKFLQKTSKLLTWLHSTFSQDDLPDGCWFWQQSTILGFLRPLAADNKHVQLRSISSARDFADTLQDDSVFGDKQVVLIIDEFDKLYRAPPEVTDSMLDVLRGIKTKKNYRLHVRSLLCRWKDSFVWRLPSFV